MRKIRILSLALALGVTSAQISCSKDSSKEQQIEHVESIDELYAMIRGLEKNLSEGALLRNAQPNERTMFSDVLHELKVSILRLRNNPHDPQALSALALATREFNDLNILSLDATQIDGFKVKLAETVDFLARLQGRTMEQVDRVLFSTEFTSELAPFVAVTLDKKNGWIKTEREEFNYALVKGGPLHSWLLSPVFDLTSVTDPRMVLKQSINSWGKPYDEAVAVMISDNYTGGDIASATWDKISIQRMPSGNDWGAIQTEPIDLSRYVGKKVVIGFKYLFTATRDIPTWQLNSVKLTGGGAFEMTPLEASALSLTDKVVGPASGPKVSEKCTAIAGAQTLFNYKFDKKNMGTNFTLNEISGTISAGESKYPGVVRFSGYVKEGNKVGQSWLISKDINVADAKDLCLSFAEDAYFAKQAVNLDMIEVLVSTDYKGDAKTATWQKINFDKRKASTATVFAETMSTTATAALLKDLVAEGSTKINVAFRYTATKEVAPWWGVSDLTVMAAPASDKPLTITKEDVVAVAAVQTGPSIAPVCKQNKDAKELLNAFFSTPEVGKQFGLFDALKNINLTPDAVKYPNAVRFSGYDKLNPRIGTSWLVSKPLDIQGQSDICVSVAEDIYALASTDDLSGVEVVFSTDYVSGEPSEATWQSVPLVGRKAQTSIANADVFKPAATGASLKSLIGADAKTLTVALRYTAKVGSLPWWGVTTLAVTGVAKAGSIPAVTEVPATPARPTTPATGGTTPPAAGPAAPTPASPTPAPADPAPTPETPAPTGTGTGTAPVGNND